MLEALGKIPQQSREGAEPWVAIKHEPRAQEVTDVVHGGVGAGFSFIPEPP